jgi:alpha-ketoglutarate-dependent taurine dioxygenase
MLRFGDRSFCPRTAIKNDSDIRATYRGYIKFLTKDIAPQINSMSKRAKGEHIAQVAQSMIVRGQMFAAAIKAQRGDFLRLSIHESTKSQKVSVSLNPQDQNAIGHTPWHSCVVVGVDGSYRAAHVDQVRNTHDLVIKNGQPYCYRERSELFDWSKEGLNVDFEHLYPCGLIIRPINNSGESPSIRTIAMSKLRQLSCNMSPVICRGFENTEGEGLFIEKAAELGKIATWSQDVIIKVKDSKRVDKENNNVKSNEAMPMHYDGMFKFYDETDPITGETTRVQNVPKYQLFLCRATASEDDDGKTLFASSRLFFRYLPSPWTRERLEKVTWSMENDGFWDAKVYKLPLLLTHPTSGQPCLRWHQPWDSTKTKFSTCKVTIDNDDASIISTIDNLIYDYRVCYRFKWKVGDLLVSDNMSMLHTRTGYSSNCDRELWRIHCD